MTIDISKINWTHSTKIPVVHETIEEMLGFAKFYFKKLKQAIKQAKKSPYSRDNNILKGIINFYIEQQEILPIHIEQCKRWKQEKLNQRQQRWVKDIEDNLAALKTTIERSVALACEFEQENKRQ